MISPEQALKVQVTWESGTNAHASLPARHLSPSLYLQPHGDFLTISWQKMGAWFSNGSAQYAGTTWKWQIRHYSPSLGHPWGTTVKGNPPSEQYTWSCTLLGRKNGQTRKYIPIHGLWAGWSAIWKERDWEIDDHGIWGRRIGIDLSGQKAYGNICDSCENSPKGDLSRGGF